MIFNRTDYDALHTLFDPEVKFPGYRPSVKELADGVTIDDKKMFHHVALKYPHTEWARAYLARAHFEACCVARRLGVRPMYMPDVENATLRTLYYPPGAGTAPHVDFNLFTIVCYRDVPGGLKRPRSRRSDALDAYSHGLHIGELGEMVGLGPATRHEVPPTDYDQRSIVYFASPRMSAPLPGPGFYVFPAVESFPEKAVYTCGDWQLERVARSRVTYK